MSTHRPGMSWERLASLVIGSVIVISAVRRGRLFSPRTVTGIGLVARGLSGLAPVGRAAVTRVR